MTNAEPANDSLTVNGLAGADFIDASTVSGAPTLFLSGGTENDTLGGSLDGDVLTGDAGNDSIDGNAGNDTTAGGDGNDTFVWNPGDGNDVIDGQNDNDTLTFNGSAVAENIAIIANGTRVSLTRDVGAVTMDIGTVETISVNALAGNDTVSGSNGLATLTSLVIDGGDNDDVITGGDGADILLGGNGNDTITPGRGNDIAFGGANDDTFVWNPGDGSDILEGQAGSDTLLFNGANVNENIDMSANGARFRFTRDVAAIVMDVDGTENVTFNAFGGADTITVENLTGTAVTNVSINLAASGGGGDGSPDSVILYGTPGNDVLTLSGLPTGVSAVGYAASVNVLFTEPASDTLTVRPLGGADTSTINSMTGTFVPQITLDLGSDGATDSVSVLANANPNSIAVTDTAAGTEVTGLTPKIVVSNADSVGDSLQISSLGGADGISVNQSGTAGAVQRVLIDAGTETDTITVFSTAATGVVVILPSTGDDIVNVNTDGVGVANVSFEATQRIGSINIQSGGGRDAHRRWKQGAHHRRADDRRHRQAQPHQQRHDRGLHRRLADRDDPIASHQRLCRRRVDRQRHRHEPGQRVQLRAGLRRGVRCRARRHVLGPAGRRDRRPRQVHLLRRCKSRWESRRERPGATGHVLADLAAPMGAVRLQLRLRGERVGSGGSCDKLASRCDYALNRDSGDCRPDKRSHLPCFPPFPGE